MCVCEFVFVCVCVCVCVRGLGGWVGGGSCGCNRVRACNVTNACTFRPL